MREDWVECCFEDLLDYEQPTAYIVESTDYKDEYITPVLTAGKTFVLGYTNETEGVFYNFPAIIFDDFTTASKFVNFKFKVKSSAMKILLPTSKLVNMKFIFYCMQVNEVRSDTHKRYWISVFSKKKFLLPSLSEQRAIISRIETLFSDLDNGIAELKKAQKQLKIYRQAVLKKAFEGKLTDNSSIEWVTLGSVCKSVEYGSSSKSLNDGEIPVLRMGNIQNGKIDWTDLKYSSDNNEIKKYQLNKNDVLFNRTNSPEHVGKTAIYRGERAAIFAGYLIRIHYIKGEVNPDYLNYFLNSTIAKQHGNKIKSFGVNQSNINGTKLKKYPFPKTTLNEQNKIVFQIEYRLTIYDNVEQSISDSLMKAEALRQSILKKAFEGKILSAAEIEKCKLETGYEPASVLLRKIKAEKNK